MPWGNLSWWHDLAYWLSQWIVFCPAITAMTRNPKDWRNEPQAPTDKWVAKIITAILVQVTTATLSVSLGAYITIKVMERDIAYNTREIARVEAEAAAKFAEQGAINKDVARRFDEQLRHERDVAQGVVGGKTNTGGR